MIETKVAGERLGLLPDHTLFWPDRGVLFVADVHIGKAATFLNLGHVPIPSGTTASTLDRLGAALEATGAGKLIVLGDLWHARAGRDRSTIDQAAGWRERFAGVEMILVEGNHDRRSGSLPPELRIEEIGEGEAFGPFVLRHHPEPDERGYVLAGHIHPAAMLTGAGKQAVRLPCFWFGTRIGVLPSFGDFTGSVAVRPRRGDGVFVACEGRVLAVGSKTDPAAL